MKTGQTKKNSPPLNSDHADSKVCLSEMVKASTFFNSCEIVQKHTSSIKMRVAGGGKFLSPSNSCDYDVDR